MKQVVNGNRLWRTMFAHSDRAGRGKSLIVDKATDQSGKVMALTNGLQQGYDRIVLRGRWGSPAVSRHYGRPE